MPGAVTDNDHKVDLLRAKPFGAVEFSEADGGANAVIRMSHDWLPFRQCRLHSGHC